MMPISNQGDYEENHFTKIYEQIIQPAVKEAGFEAFRVDEDRVSENIMSKIYKAIQECEMAVCDLSNRNPNVLYELGLRHAYDKPVVLIQDEKTDRIFDISGISTVTYYSSRKYDDVMQARVNISKAIKSTMKSQITMAGIMKATQATIPDGISNIDFLNLKVDQILKAIDSLNIKRLDNILSFDERQYIGLLLDCAEIACELLITDNLTIERWNCLHSIVKNSIMDKELGNTYYTKELEHVYDLLLELFSVLKKKRPGCVK